MHLPDQKKSKTKFEWIKDGLTAVDKVSGPVDVTSCSKVKSAITRPSLVWLLTYLVR
jgi:hypothetical protein